MTKFLLSLHVLAAIIAVGPITVAASMFPPSARRALAEPGSERAVSAVRLLHRICRVYGGVGIAVPVLGFATAMSMGVLKDAWLIVSMLLTALAAMVLLALVLPRQEEILEAIGAGDGGNGEGVEEIGGDAVGTPAGRRGQPTGPGPPSEPGPPTDQRPSSGQRPPPDSPCSPGCSTCCGRRSRS